MSENKVDEVFDRWSLTCAAAEVPEPGTDDHAPVDGGNRVWNGVIDTKRKITLAADGTGEISGVNVIIKCEFVNSNVTKQNTIIGGMVAINP